MNHSVKVGVSFGLTSGIITTMGLMVGLNAGTHSRLAVIGGIITIAVADAASDAMGIHMSEESEGKHTEKQVWTSTLATFITKLLFALTFLIPVLLLNLNTAVIVSVVWGLLALTGISTYLAKQQKKVAWKVSLEHLALGIGVIIVTYFVGRLVSMVFA
ncbi:VIT1/CCC1 transporter family protein [Nanoarchaeota archaeon]